jgi:uncharacterized membrane protein YbhN (UPF0104 family)
MSEGILVGLLILWALTGWWLVAAVALAAYLWCGVRYARRVKVKAQPYSWKDWAGLLALWWWFALLTRLNRR